MIRNWGWASMRLDDARELENILGPADGIRCLLITPVFNDFACAAQLLRDLQKQVPADIRRHTAVLLVNDGSTEPKVLTPSAELRVFEMTLHANLGHQRAIAVALGVVSRWLSADAVLVVLDCDGEDRPEDVPRLIEAARAHPDRLILANRARRSEALGFRIGYGLYQLLYRLLTGHNIRHGNFSAMSGRLATKLAFVPSLWNHYAATLDKCRIPTHGIDVIRGHRYSGTSRMNLVALIAHGLSAISVHIETAGVRMLLAFLGLGLTALSAGLTVAMIKILTPWAIPGWASTMVGLFTILAIVGLAACVQLIFTVLAARERPPVLVAYDAWRFVKTIRPVQ